jgi:predicted nucleotidyltransferase
MFTVDRREAVRTTLLARAREDPRIVGAAITGSAASDAEDRWSDIDLFFGVADGAAVADVLGDWSDFVYGELGALHHFDLHSGLATYRAFLLADRLEVDLAFTPAARFGPLGAGAFRVVFGASADRPAAASGDPAHLLGLAWHHVLHARIAIERGHAWQAEYWISGVRDHVIALACLRLGLPAMYAKGADALPDPITGPLEDALVRALDRPELLRALKAATSALIRELKENDPPLAGTLGRALVEIAAG